MKPHSFTPGYCPCSLLSLQVTFLSVRQQLTRVKAIRVAKRTEVPLCHSFFVLSLSSSVGSPWATEIIHCAMDLFPEVPPAWLSGSAVHCSRLFGASWKCLEPAGSVWNHLCPAQGSPWPLPSHTCSPYSAAAVLKYASDIAGTSRAARISVAFSLQKV